MMLFECHYRNFINKLFRLSRNANKLDQEAQSELCNANKLVQD
jgi:hypothetical protein